MATVSERAGVVGPSELREIAWDGGQRAWTWLQRGAWRFRGSSARRERVPYDEVEWESAYGGDQGRARPDHFPADGL